MAASFTDLGHVDAYQSSASLGITLSGSADVLLVISGYASAASAALANLTDGGAVDDDKAADQDSNTASAGCAIYVFPIRGYSAGSYTVSVGGFSGFVAYEVTGVDETLEAVAGSAGSIGDSSLSDTITTLTNGAAVAAGFYSGSAESVIGVSGVLDTVFDDGGTRTFGAGYTGDSGTLGIVNYGFSFSATLYTSRWAAVALTLSGEIPPIDVDLTFSGVVSGSEVRIYETSHEAIWTIDTAGITAATAGEKVVEWNAWYSGLVVEHKLWIDIDNLSTIPAAITATAWAGSTAYAVDDVRLNGDDVYTCTTAGTSAASGGPTGYGTGIADGSVVWSHAWRIHEADNSTGDDDAAIAAEIAATINAADGVASSSASTVVTVTHEENGQVSIPTTDAAVVVDVFVIGGTVTEVLTGFENQIDGIETTSGDWVSTVTVGSPRYCDIAIIRNGEGAMEPFRIRRFRLDRTDAVIPIQQRIDRNYSDPV